MDARAHRAVVCMGSSVRRARAVPAAGRILDAGRQRSAALPRRDPARRRRSAATAIGASAIVRRDLAVLGSTSWGSLSIRWRVARMVTLPRSRSMAVHVNPSNSDMRAPVVSAKTNRASRRWSRATVSKRPACSAVIIGNSRGTALGGSESRATLRTTAPHRTAFSNMRCSTLWTCRTVVGDNPDSNRSLYSVCKCDGWRRASRIRPRVGNTWTRSRLS